jgi:S1-C subfamily serine protease
MKKILMFLLLVTSLSGCFYESELPELQMSTSEYSMEIGDYLVLTTNKDNVIWTSENDGIATVENGLVHAIGKGITNIIAKTDDQEVKARIVVKPIPIHYIEITGKQMVKVNETITLIGTIHSTVISDNLLTWFSNDPTIAKVDDGVVTGLNRGVVTITATSVVDSSLYAQYTVYVEKSDFDFDLVYRTIYETIGELNFQDFNNKIVQAVNNVNNAFIGVSNYNITNDLDSIGSGIIFEKSINGESFIYKALTNNHVIEDNNYIKAYLGNLDISLPARVLKSNAALDLALIEFESTIDINPVNLSERPIEVGNHVIAIGNPTGYEYYGSVTLGIVSYKDRFVEGQKYIQHDASINSGNSGGPLLDLDGNIVGINTLKLININVEGMGFAIPIEVVKAFLNE